MRRPYLSAVLPWLAPIGALGRSVLTLSNWARESGIAMHPSVEWKDNGGGDWGLQLTSEADRGAVLMRVPRSLVLDSAAIRDEISRDDGRRDRMSECAEALGRFGVHEENFWIVLGLYERHRQEDPKWAPWLAGMPQTFPEFSEAERECLPFYARYIADYQRQKLERFREAAEVICGTLDEEQRDEFKWAFNAVGSRFWKTESAVEENYQPRSELVPLGDMFNHRDPPNVKIVHDKEEDAVCFLYLGGGEECVYPRDLFITYGQPYNPHRFLMIFGFVPDDMKEMWSHLTLSESNAYASDVPRMVFACEDGTVAQQVWDAVLSELDPSKGVEALRASPRHRWHAADVLNNHVTKQLDELNSLRLKIDDTEGENMGLIRRHNELLTTVFRRVQDNLKEELEKGKK
eukprot:CAMPEP_0172554988 /NCGR_PEP_ID=MMETSP1067-20121228/57443_1 /TAXON_ID=265564 ORGANISM="Thalassiosira punctigera, Strain Tpunct2005C2" /NCGR_SAMPLE_ID=MMETSP1067 /ASSEMBLY_ACC=CAM_ASM_000444 /LENGTH=403 /DNA_ID=CAMNT_0013343479 /DNA_START=96 /DNA_END=1307 /DNA_ORIENTATION=-